MAQTEMEADLFGGSMPPPPAPRAKPEPRRTETFKSISETADMLSLPQHVLRFWESKFGNIKPIKLKGGRRYYRAQDIEALLTIKHLLYKEGYTIKGARRALSQNRKREAAPMPRDTALKSRPRMDSMEDTPLFAMLAPALPQPVAAAPSPRKEELRKIHSELLELRALIGELPPLSPHI